MNRPIVFGSVPFSPFTTGWLHVPTLILRTDRNGNRWFTHVSLAGPPGELRATLPLPDFSSQAFQVWNRQDPSWWADGVGRILAEIDAKRLVKAVLARAVVIGVPGPTSRGTLANRISAAIPGAYAYALRIANNADFAGGIPELLVERLGANVCSRPLAGTVAHGEGQVSGQTVSEPKIRHEHHVTVHDVVENLRLVGATTTVGSTTSIHLPNMTHLGTQIDATFGGGPPSALAVVASLHPTAAVAGFPRHPALRLIRAIEPTPRGPYAGPIGWMDSSGDGEWTVGLRSAVISGGRAILQAGAGIVHGSDPDQEWDETTVKLKATAKALELLTPESSNVIAHRPGS